MRLLRSAASGPSSSVSRSRHGLGLAVPPTALLVGVWPPAVAEPPRHARSRHPDSVSLVAPAAVGTSHATLSSVAAAALVHGGPIGRRRWRPHHPPLCSAPAAAVAAYPLSPVGSYTPPPWAAPPPPFPLGCCRGVCLCCSLCGRGGGCGRATTAVAPLARPRRAGGAAGLPPRPHVWRDAAATPPAGRVGGVCWWGRRRGGWRRQRRGRWGRRPPLRLAAAGGSPPWGGWREGRRRAGRRRPPACRLAPRRHPRGPRHRHRRGCRRATSG